MMRIAVALTMIVLLGASCAWRDLVKYKFVTSGQYIDDVPVYEFTLQGNSLKPPSPVHITGQRDSSGNLVITWTRRVLIPALAGFPYSELGNPLAMEAERYRVEILSGPGGNLVRSTMVPSSLALPVVWLASTPYTTITGSSVTNNQTVFENFAQAESLQKLDGSGDWTEAILRASSGDTIASMRVTTSGGGVIGYRLDWGTGLGSKISVYEVTRNRDSESSTLRAQTDYVDGDRVRIERTENGIWFYRNPIGGGARVFYTGATRFDEAEVFSLLPIIGGAATPAILADAVIQTINPTFVYSVEMQVADFGSAQSAVSLRIAQLSPIVGVGHWRTATL